MRLPIDCNAVKAIDLTHETIFFELTEEQWAAIREEGDAILAVSKMDPSPVVIERLYLFGGETMRPMPPDWHETWEEGLPPALAGDSDDFG